jgi:DMSO/TMAO reductase YedYZ heme-binding membrane subunit
MRTLPFIQNILLGVSILILLILPTSLAFYPEYFPASIIALLFSISHVAVFFTMAIRPLADLTPSLPSLRRLILLRQGFGVLSASIPISLLLAKIIISPVAFFANMGTLTYWSLQNFALLAHLADISALILIITSNTASKLLLGAWWKRVQRLSYVYFYTSMVYVLFAQGHTEALVSLLAITFLTLGAYLKKKISARTMARSV